MKINERAYALGCKRSVIREIFEYSKTRAAEIGAENVFDFSLGNPSVKPPEKVTETILELLNNSSSTLLHGYTSAQGDAEVRKSVANHIKKSFGVNITENEIYMKYNEMTRGRTSIFISHRLASTRFCDRILFVSDGHIAEEGTHEELLAKGGGYAELFEVQSKYYREESAENEEK